MNKFLLPLALLFCSAPALSAQAVAAWTINTSSCTTTAPCTAQIYRAVIASGNCPAAGNSAYTEIQSALLATFPSATQSTWQYSDSGAALVSGQVYCGYATVTFTAGGGPGVPSANLFKGRFRRR